MFSVKPKRKKTSFLGQILNTGWEILNSTCHEPQFRKFKLRTTMTSASFGTNAVILFNTM